jgi:hypothetical protein
MIDQSLSTERGSCCVPPSSTCPASAYERWLDSHDSNRPTLAPMFGLCLFTESQAAAIGCDSGANSITELTKCQLEAGSFYNCKRETSRGDTLGVQDSNLLVLWQATGAFLVAAGSLQLICMIVARSCRRARRETCESYVAALMIVAAVPIGIACILAAVGSFKGDDELSRRVYLQDTEFCAVYSGFSDTCIFKQSAVFQNLSGEGYSGIKFNEQECPFVNATAASLRYSLLFWEPSVVWLFLFASTLTQLVLVTTIASYACCRCVFWAPNVTAVDEKMEEFIEDIRMLR